MEKLLIVGLLLFSGISVAQKKKIDHTTYDEWNHLEGIRQSRDGDIVVYQTQPLEGDGVLSIHDLANKTQKNFDRGAQAKIAANKTFVAFLIKPEHDSLRQLKLDGVKKNKLPKDSLGIYFLANDSIAKVANISSFKIAEEGSNLAYLLDKSLLPKLSKKELKKLKKKGIKKSETSGKTMFVYNASSFTKKKIHRVKTYQFNREGTHLAYTTSHKGKKDSVSFHILNVETGEKTVLAKRVQSIGKYGFNYQGDQLVYLLSNDTGEVKNYALYNYDISSSTGQLLIDSTTSGMPEGWCVNNNYTPKFSRDGSKLYVGTAELLRKEAEDTLLPIEKAKVDVWSGTDLRIQPEQLKSLKRDQNKTYLAVYHLNESKFIQLEDEDFDKVYPRNFNNADLALAYENSEHARERNWAFPWKQDYYTVDINTGERKLLKKEVLHGGSISPSSEFFVWYNGADSNWYSKGVVGDKEMNLTKDLNLNFASDNNGMPFSAYPESSNGWLKIDGQEYYMVKTYYDIWLLNPTDPTKHIPLTNQKDSRTKMRYWLARLNQKDSLYISLEASLIKGMDDLTKDESVYSIEQSNGNYTLNQLYQTNHSITAVLPAKEGKRLLMRRMNFQTYPDLESTDMSFSEVTKLSDANPQQKDYNWGTVEFVDWQAYDSTQLRGLLYKPENFDPNKKYPMIVYFYEDYQDRFHVYYSPKPTASIVYPTEYVSNEYIIFIPDVKYKAGYPAKSAYNCIVSGTDYLCEKYEWIDTNKLGLQGQSWGGYQTAQLITMTDKYAAAMAGAPVSNMFSAYGGIRWGSGMSRMFQYERTQSRIGYTIWEKPELYTENSPLFGLPNVTTPVLIMHNDNDGAVPWYQGIEMYMGLRRLDKTVWLLNYNGDAHNLRKLANKRDLSRRMKQFFDHYLQDAPMPSWMKNGVPAIDKGINYGFEIEK